MDKIKKMALTLLVFAIGLGIMNVNAEQGIVGVKVGDWAVYSCDLGAGTSILNETVKIEVTSIVSTTIYYNLTWDPPVSDTNNTQLNLMFSNTGYVDVLTGAYGGSYAGYFIAVNGSGAPLGGATYSMSRRVLMQYLGQTFEITHLIASGTGIQEDLHWVRSTGVLTELEISANGLSDNAHHIGICDSRVSSILSSSAHFCSSNPIDSNCTS
jgi:hypothetical protein